MTQIIESDPQDATAFAPAGPATLEDIRAFLYREARFLDDRDFDRWLDCYHPEA